MKEAVLNTVGKDNRPPKHLRTLKRGDVREDGMVFYGYRASSKDGEWWMEATEFSQKQQRAKELRAEYRKNNLEREREMNRQYNAENKEYLYEKKKEYIAANPDRVRRWWRNDMDRRLSNPETKLIHYQRTRINQALRGKGKSKQTLELIGCTAAEFKAHIESQFQEGMSWDNYGEWHVDHIKPCSIFNLLLDRDQEVCFNFRNTQPLWASDNLSKGNKYNHQ